MKDRARINRILDKLNDEELHGIWLFLVGATGYSGMEEDNECQD